MLAWLNATLAILVALLGVAPLTGAPVALALFAPAAIMFAFFGQRTPAVLAAGAVPLAIALSPIKLEQLLHKPALYWFIWVSVAAAATTVVALQKSATQREHNDEVGKPIA